ncbi:hypothetical protein [Carnobacterium funditum]|uniref:hypothetical protein n=1 Tax=Carnobacterium funditum TaxID=2752 RepID=UPI003CCB9FD7
MGYMTESDVIHLLNESKKELDRLTAKRTMDLSNSISYIENELEIQRIKGKITAYEYVLNVDE